MSAGRLGQPAGAIVAPDQDGMMVTLQLAMPETRERPLGPGLAVLAALLAPVLPDPAATAFALLNRFGSVTDVLAAADGPLGAVPGMTSIAVTLLHAAPRLVSFALQEQFARDVIGSWSALERWARLNMGAIPNERLVALFLDKKNGLLREEQLYEGTVDHVPLYPREIVKHALALNASAVILLHNHPSGDPTPSQEDIVMTRRVASVLAELGIALHDHAIVGRKRVTSLRQSGRL